MLDKREVCPRCGSKMVQNLANAVCLLMVFICLAVSSMLAPINDTVRVIFIAAVLGPTLLARNVLVCRDCKKIWIYNKPQNRE